MKKTDKLLQQFELYLQEKGRKQSTIQRYLYDLRYYFKFCKINDQSKISEFDEILLYNFCNFLREEKKYSENTIYKTTVVLNTFQKFIKWQQKDQTISNFSHSLTTERKIALHNEDFLRDFELRKLIYSLHSLNHFSDHQLPARIKLQKRNISIMLLLIYYGVTLQELVNLTMKDFSFVSNKIHVFHNNNGYRMIQLTQSTINILLSYLHDIPEPVRPRYNSNDPFFVAFDFNRKTFKWVYETEMPKRMTAITVQKFIREEVARAGLRRGISAQTFRNSYVLHLLLNEETETNILTKTGNLSKNSLRSYRKFLVTTSQEFLESFAKYSEDEWIESKTTIQASSKPN